MPGSQARRALPAYDVGRGGGDGDHFNPEEDITEHFPTATGALQTTFLSHFIPPFGGHWLVVTFSCLPPSRVGPGTTNQRSL